MIFESDGHRTARCYLIWRWCGVWQSDISDLAAIFKSGGDIRIWQPSHSAVIFNFGGDVHFCQSDISNLAAIFKSGGDVRIWRRADSDMFNNLAKQYFKSDGNILNIQIWWRCSDLTASWQRHFKLQSGSDVWISQPSHRAIILNWWRCGYLTAITNS